MRSGHAIAALARCTGGVALTEFALALPLLRAAVVFINEMASFESAGVSDKAS